MNSEKVFKKAIKIVKRASKIYYKKSFIEAHENYKYEGDDVTSNDILTQDFLVKEFSKLLPGSTFCAEEKLNNASPDGYVWVIDPIDGTANYKNDVDFYGTQVALKHNGKVIFSALYMPMCKQMYYSWGGKSFCNGKQIFTSKNNRSANVNIMGSLLTKDKLPFTIETLLSFFRRRKLRIYGACLYAFVAVACGKTDCFILNSSAEWDIAPGLFLAENAGAKTLILKEYNILIVAGNNEILNDAVAALKL